jgi:hypothetical protein
MERQRSGAVRRLIMEIFRGEPARRELGAMLGVYVNTSVRDSDMPKTEDHISPANIMRITGIGHRFSICRKGDKWLATYDGEAQAVGQTRMDAVQKLNQALNVNKVMKAAKEEATSETPRQRTPCPR